MSMAKRGRPKGTRLRDAQARRERGERVESLWRAKYAAVGRDGADGAATEATARELGLTPRRVRQIRRAHREEVELFRRGQRQVAETLRRHSEYWGPKLETVSKLLTAAAWEQLKDLDAGWEIVERLADGIAAQEENRNLRAQIEQFKKRERVWKDLQGK